MVIETIIIVFSELLRIHILLRKKHVKLPEVTMWCGLSAKSLIRPLFLDI